MKRTVSILRYYKHNLKQYSINDFISHKLNNYRGLDLFQFSKNCTMKNSYNVLGFFQAMATRARISRVRVLAKTAVFRKMRHSPDSRTFAEPFCEDSPDSPTFAKPCCADLPDLPTLAKPCWADSPDSQKASLASVTRIWRVWQTWGV